MKKILSFLNNPALVSSYQSLCGVIIDKDNQNSDSLTIKNNLFFETKLNNTTLIEKDSRKRNNLNSTANVYQNDEKLFVETDNNNDNQIKKTNKCSESKITYSIKNYFLYYYFHFASGLGNEIFYVLFFSFWYWNVDVKVGRKLCLFWCFFMYIGQASKDLLKLPRPHCPPVIRFGDRCSAEYGMPSTHSMVAAGIPLCLVYLLREEYIFSNEHILWLFCLCWCSSICLSRIYLGMHSFLDVIVGIIYVFLLFPVFIPFIIYIDRLFLFQPLSPIVCILSPILLGLLYPKLHQYSTTREDTLIILSVTFGVMFSLHVGFSWLGIFHKTPDKSNRLYKIDVLNPLTDADNNVMVTWDIIGCNCLILVIRTFIGLIIVAVSRLTLKKNAAIIANQLYTILNHSETEVKCDGLLSMNLNKKNNNSSVKKTINRNIKNGNTHVKNGNTHVENGNCHVKNSNRKSKSNDKNGSIDSLVGDLLDDIKNNNIKQLNVIDEFNSQEEPVLSKEMHLSYELPLKYLTYFPLTIVGTLFCPLIFQYLGIERVAYFHEI